GAPRVTPRATTRVTPRATTRVTPRVRPRVRPRATPRGVTVTGPVFVRGADRLRALRYEVRCWEGGAIPDLDYRIGPAHRVAHTDHAAAAVLAQARLVPALTWGRRARLGSEAADRESPARRE